MILNCKSKLGFLKFKLSLQQYSLYHKSEFAPKIPLKLLVHKKEQIKNQTVDLYRAKSVFTL